jgi:hypothetical protein
VAGSSSRGAVSGVPLCVSERVLWVGERGTDLRGILLLSYTERRQFEAIRTGLAADPQFAGLTRAAARRIRRQQFWTWLAPLLVARRAQRRRARMLAYGT